MGEASENGKRKQGVGGKDEFYIESLLFCSVVFPYKPKMPPQLLTVGEILQELKVLGDS